MGAEAAALARRLLNQHPPDRLKHLESPRPHLLVAGERELARQLVLGLLRLCHFRHGRPPLVTVLSREEMALPGAEFIAPVQRVPDIAELESLLGLSPPVNAIYLGGDCDLPGLRRLFRGFPPPVNAPEPIAASFPLAQGLDAESGPDHSEAVARTIHELYLQEQLARGRKLGDWPTLRPWQELTDADRDGNRYLADHIRLKLREVDYHPSERGGGLQLNERELDELARAEHSRWAAVRYLNGWRHGASRDDALKLHPDLVPFDSLSRAIQDLDRMAVRATDAYLAQAGLAVAPAAPVRLAASGDAPEPAFEGNARRLLAELAQHYPDRRLVLRSTLATPLERAFAAVALNAGAALTAVVADAEPPEALLPLLRRSERIEVAAEPEAAVVGAARLTVALGAPQTRSDRALVVDTAGRVLSRPWRSRP